MSERVLPVLTKDALVLVVDEFGRDHFSMEDGRPVCGRLKKEKNRSIANEACLAPPMANGACKVHGGKAGAPIRTGRYSRVLKRWLGEFEAARSDQELLDVRGDLAMMDVAIAKLVEQAEEMDSPSWRADLRARYGQLRAAIRSGKQKDVGEHLRVLGELIEGGASTDQVVQDLIVHLDRRANRAGRVAEQESKTGGVVTTTELAAVFRQWLEVLERALPAEDYYRVLPELGRLTRKG